MGGLLLFFDSDLLEKVKGKIVEFGVEKLVGASARLEMVVDGSALNYILQTDTAAKVQVSIPASASSVTLRIIIFPQMICIVSSMGCT